MPVKSMVSSSYLKSNDKIFPLSSDFSFRISTGKLFLRKIATPLDCDEKWGETTERRLDPDFHTYFVPKILKYSFSYVI